MSEGRLLISSLQHPLTICFAALQNADDLIAEVLQAADINRDGRIQFDGQRDFWKRSLLVPIADLYSRIPSIREPDGSTALGHV